MGEKYTNEVILDVRSGNKEDLHNTIEEISFARFRSIRKNSRFFEDEEE
ncbi:hypothetical protein [Bacillus wiedmannii]|nr:hypothetical protein [Bacillus wiedmannii]